MNDDHETVDIDLRDVEAELCRLPDVAAVRIVGDPNGRPIEVHVLANPGKHAKQVVRDIQSVALASFDLDLDRRIVSVVQLGAEGANGTSSAVPATIERPRIAAIETQTAGLHATVRVMLTMGDDEAAGVAEGSVAAAARPRLVASATIDALQQLEPAAECLHLEAAQELRVGNDHVLVVTLIAADPPRQQLLVGSAVVHHLVDDAAVRAVLDATNRRLAYLTPKRA